MRNTDLEKQYKALPLKERIAMSLSETIPENYRLFLAQDQWNVIRCYFSRRVDLLETEISTLIEDDDYVVRLSVAKRDDLTPSQVEKCVVDTDPNVRHAIARSTRLTNEQRTRLLNDADDLVQRSAKKGARKAVHRQRDGQAKLIK